MLSALRKLLTATGVFAAAAMSLMAGTVSAEPQNGGASAPPAAAGPAVAVPRGVGGYSMTLSDIWGPPKMPPAPKDFGPGFDFPPEPLNGGVTQDPYPN
ncbi:hypothetical protein [Methyloceanibacter sp.]|uniref:hypothetical protein n=1 Tax=Methyloceanibacter sp. TaxID=1965321 RepID=UPI002D27F381|nr:hypothetical protein [Methyloceanibacter sp.]HZP08341.1 hypothetical protein [Methyloceanibacter sp.]